MSDSNSSDGANGSPTDRDTEERVFLHDLASPLAVASGMIEIALRELQVLQSQEPSLEKQIQRLEKTKNAITRMTDLMKARRAVLIARQDDKSE